MKEVFPIKKKSRIEIERKGNNYFLGAYGLHGKEYPKQTITKKELIHFSILCEEASCRMRDKYNDFVWAGIRHEPRTCEDPFRISVIGTIYNQTRIEFHGPRGGSNIDEVLRFKDAYQLQALSDFLWNYAEEA